jgi:hypothetical protein
MSFKMHDGTEFKTMTKVWGHDGTEFQLLSKVWMHDGTEFQLVYTAGAQLTAASAIVGNYADSGDCVDLHYNTISWTLDSACSGETIAIYDPVLGEFVSGLSCGASPYDHYPFDPEGGQQTSAGTGFSWTYTVRVYSGGDIISYYECSTITAQDDSTVVCL